jgi:REP element-mobilizing transposase RayT
MIAHTLISVPDTFPHVDIVDFVVMPDHMHVIVELADDGSGTVVSLGKVIGRFKSVTRHRYSLGVKSLGWPPYVLSFWEQGFHDHIIRDEADLANCMNYIEQNPIRWAEKRRDPR